LRYKVLYTVFAHEQDCVLFKFLKQLSQASIYQKKNVFCSMLLQNLN